MKLSIAVAADILLSGGVIAYPTEGVFGLGCLPDDPFAIVRLLSIKRRDPRKGLILIASEAEQLRDWIAMDPTSLPEPDPARPTTWIATASEHASALIRGAHPGLAVRLTTNPTAAALCEATGSALVSTSANLAGEPVARNRFVLTRKFGQYVDYIVPGDCGPASGPSEIRDLNTGTVLRAAMP
jgi:L-threonylcarbamoyladenylate synthase